jgi:PhnB protein
MNFYKKCLGGKLTIQTIGASPLADTMPARMKKCILHSTLKKGSMVIMATDMVADKGLIKGNSVSLLLNCGSEKEIRTYYKNLSAGGEATHPLHESFWGALFGDLTDKYGNNWLLHFDKNAIQSNACPECPETWLLCHFPERSLQVALLNKTIPTPQTIFYEHPRHHSPGYR